MSGVVKLNPAIFADRRDALAVVWNEALRLFMEDEGFEPEFEVTPAQLEFFKGTAYSPDDAGEGTDRDAARGGDAGIEAYDPKRYRGRLANLITFRSKIKEGEESPEARDTAVLATKGRPGPGRAAVENLVTNQGGKRDAALASGLLLSLPVTGPLAVAHRGAVSAVGAALSGAGPLTAAADAYAVRTGAATPGQIERIERIANETPGGLMKEAGDAAVASWHAPFTSDSKTAPGVIGLAADAAQGLGNYLLSREMDRLAGVEPSKAQWGPAVNTAVAGTAVAALLKGAGLPKFDKTVGFAGEALGNLAMNTTPKPPAPSVAILSTLDTAKRALAAEADLRRRQSTAARR